MNETIALVIEQIKALATALEGPSKHVYEVLVRQAVVEGCYSVFIGVASLCLAVAAGKAAQWGLRQEPKSYDDLTGNVVFVLGLLAGGILVAVAMAHLSGVLQIVNPEYYAIKELLGVL